MQQSEILEGCLSSKFSNQLHSYSAESEEEVNMKCILGNPQSENRGCDLDLFCWNCRHESLLGPSAVWFMPEIN